MNTASPAADPAWADAVWAATLFAVDPHGLGGITLRASAGPVRDHWTQLLRELFDKRTPWRRMPSHIGDERLLGGLDLPATLQAGRPVAQRGLLAECDGGVLLLPMAERLSAATAARLAHVLDRGEIGAEREGVAQRWPCRIGIVAFDEGRDDDPALPTALSDRLAFRCDLGALGWGHVGDASHHVADIQAARQRLPQVTLAEPIAQALCATAQRMGVDSLRASLLALRAARAAAALHGRSEVSEDDARLAARLVLAPRATVAPPPDTPQEQAAPDTPPPPPHEDGADGAPGSDDAAQALEDRLVSAAQAALPAGLLAALLSGEVARSAGRVGALSGSPRSGRPVGSRTGTPRGGARLNLIDTLRAAAPWQRLRAASAPPGPQRVQVRGSDLRVARLQQRAATATLFVIDASGSSALHRLAEAKGAVNLLLAECYVRRDQVGVIAFRGRSADVLLPPTRSLVRAKRSLAELPGGGGTPLAAGLQAALAMAALVRRAGAVPVVVLLTDGRANVALDGGPGRARAEADALQMARLLRGAGLTTLLVDTSPQPSAAAQRLAQALGAPYRTLPHAGAVELSAAVRALPRSTH
ncbi:MAG: magnesium chelatase subunit D [Burkholderiaceae bacterium]|nr:magnesium chelatase subunit D [Burkholderiaceae bacterium]